MTAGVIVGIVIGVIILIFIGIFVGTYNGLSVIVTRCGAGLRLTSA